MKPLIETIRNIETHQSILRRRPYGMIEAANGKLVKIQLKPWPKLASLMEAHWIQRMKTRRHQNDVCRLFYNQPMGHRNYLALAYVESSFKTSLKTLYATLDSLNQIAFLKRSDAILCELTNSRLTDRFMVRRGWERHMEHKSSRHWIKRFYGNYPESAKRISTNSDFVEKHASDADSLFNVPASTDVSAQ